MGNKQNNREYWNDALNIYLSEYFYDNVTDFNDSTCYTYFVASNENQFTIGSQSLNEFLNAGNVAYYVKMQVACNAPLICVFFCQYDKSPRAFCTSGTPYTQTQKDIYDKLEQFANDNHLKIVRHVDMLQSVYHEYFENKVE